MIISTTQILTCAKRKWPETSLLQHVRHIVCALRMWTRCCPALTLNCGACVANPAIVDDLICWKQLEVTVEPCDIQYVVSRDIEQLFQRKCVSVRQVC